MKKQENGIEYQFNADPMYLMACCDLNCRSMLWTLVQLSSYYSDKDGWFFRTNEDLKAQSQLSENLVRATISTLYRLGIVDVQTVGKGKSKTPNKFRLNVGRFKDWEQYSLEDCIKHPDLRIVTDNYKAKDWQPSYLKQLKIETQYNSADNLTILSKPSQSEHYIDNVEIENNKENKVFEGSTPTAIKSSLFEAYKKREDELMDKLYNVSNWTDFTLYRKLINQLISTAQTMKIAEKTRLRYKKIEGGKIRFFKSIISKEPYNSFYDDFYREYDCGWLGKDSPKSEAKSVQSYESLQRGDSSQSINSSKGMSIDDLYRPEAILKKDIAVTSPDFVDDSDDYDLPF